MKLIIFNLFSMDKTFDLCSFMYSTVVKSIPTMLKISYLISMVIYSGKNQFWQ